MKNISTLLIVLTTILIGGQSMAITVKSGAFANEGLIPKQFTCSGADISPPIEWSGVPKGTRSICLIMDDPDAPAGTWVHWVIYNLPPDSTSLAENTAKTERLPNGALQGMNDFKRVGYGGPCPPPGPAHRYFFKVYALKEKIDLPPKATKAAIEAAISDKILDRGVLMGRFGR